MRDPGSTAHWRNRPEERGPKTELSLAYGNWNTLARYFPGYFSSRVVLQNNGGLVDGYYGSNFGFVSTLLREYGASRYPAWYLNGMALAFAGSSFSDDTMTLGEVRADYGPILTNALLNTRLFPMKDIMELPAGHESFNKSTGTRALYQAQCWFFAHLVNFEGLYRDEMNQYVKRIADGEKPTSAFGASFKASYADLDETLKKAMKEPMRGLQVSMIDTAKLVQPRKLTPLEANAVLAELGALAASPSAKSPNATENARQVLKKDPTNETALRAQLLLALASRDDQAVVDASDRLETLGTLTAASHQILGDAYAGLSVKQFASPTASPIAPWTVLRDKAKSQFEAVLKAAPEDLDGLVSLARLHVFSRDQVSAKELAKRLERSYYQHPYSYPVANTLSNVFRYVGDNSSAFRFAVVAVRIAPSEMNRQISQRSVDQLRPLLPKQAEGTE